MDNKVIILPVVKDENEESKRVMKKRVCAYIRVSTEEQENSYEEQREFFTKKIKENSLWDFAGLYADQGKSGTQKKGRVAYLKMMEDAKIGMFDYVLCKSVTRFGRDEVDVLSGVKDLKELGIPVKFELEGFSSFDENSEMFLSIYATMASDYSRQLSKNIKRGNDRRFTEGKTYGNKLILGYTKDEDGNLVIDEKQAEIVKLIYKLYLEDCHGVSKISKLLTENKYITATGKTKWNSTSILSVLKNVKYTGTLLQQKYWTPNYRDHKQVINRNDLPKYFKENNHISIISKEYFERVQLELRRRGELKNVEIAITKDGKVKHTKHSNRYGFSGKIFCGNCGNSFRRTIWHKGKQCERIVWECSTYALDGKAYCSIGAIPQDTLYNALKVIVNDFKQDENINEAIDEVVNTLETTINSSETQKQIKTGEKELVLLTEKKDNLIDRLTEGRISEQEYDTKRADIVFEIDQINSWLGNAKTNNLSVSDKIEKIRVFGNLLKKNQIIDNDNIEEYVIKIVQKVIVHSKTKFDIFITLDSKQPYHFSQTLDKSTNLNKVGSTWNISKYNKTSKVGC